jgi:propionyl-CoA synthetase
VTGPPDQRATIEDERRCATGTPSGPKPPRAFPDAALGSVIDESRAPFIQWFPGGVLNTCYNAVDRHVERGRASSAIIYDSPVTGVTQAITYRELQDEVALLAGALRRQESRRATASSSTCPACCRRSSPCSPARARRHSLGRLGGFASKELATHR